MSRKYINRRNEKEGKKKIVLTLIILLVIIGLIGISTFKLFGENQRVLANGDEKPQIPNQKEEDKGTDVIVDEAPQIKDNSGYLNYKEDNNADDAKVVAKNIQGLLTGKKSYPIRKDGKKVAYLTFDDGPSTTITPKILDILEKNDVKATFFILGSILESNIGADRVLKEIVSEGHAIGNHTYSHDYSNLYPNRVISKKNFMSDIKKNNKALKKVLGKDFYTRIIRFPGGYWSWDGREKIRPVLDKEGYSIIDWNTLSGDADGTKKNSKELVNYLKENVQSKGEDCDFLVVLMHDTYGKDNTIESLQGIIDYLKDEGYEFRTIK